MANTTYQGWAKPTIGGSEDSWGATINTALDSIDTLVGPVTAAEIAKLDGLTSSTAQLNILTGVTTSAAELNLLTGGTAFAGTLLDDANAAAARTTLGLATVASSGSYADLSNTPTATSGLATSNWQAGTSTTEAIVSPAKVKAAVLALAPTYSQPTAIGAVGTYAWLARTATGVNDYINQGQDIAGSALIFSGIARSIGNGIFPGSGTQPAGTWRAMGVMQVGFGGFNTRMCLFLRIS